ncbi:MAG: 50S ribosomal protein L18 [Bdellovibrionales bacterium]|nr:50S ribosomal protein L18 [Bdellovibrionales bacterium]
MKVKFSKRTADKVVKRLKNRARVRKKVRGTVERPRLAVFKSTSHTYAQLIDDVAGKVLVAASTKSENQSKKNLDASKAVGAALAKKAMEKNIKNVVFDRSGYVYHGRVKAVADGAREGGLNF